MYEVQIENADVWKYAYINEEGRINTYQGKRPEFKINTIKQARLIVLLAKMHYHIIPIDFKYIKFVNYCGNGIKELVKNATFKIVYKK